MRLHALRCPRSRRALVVLVAALTAAAASGRACGQIIEQEAAPSPAAPRYGEGVATRYRVGAEIKAKGGTVRDIRLMVAVPLECPEQRVEIVEEDFSPHIDAVDFRTLPTEKNAPAAARQMLILCDELPPRQEGHALITYEVITRAVLAPEDPSLLKIPAKPPRWLKPYLAGSPYINVDHRKIRDAVREALAAPKQAAPPTADAAVQETADETSAGEVADESAYEEVATTAEDEAAAPAGDEAAAAEKATAAAAPEAPAELPAAASDQPGDPPADEQAAPPPTRTDWQKVEAIYDYVQGRVKYEEGAQDKSALEALQQGKADCHGIAALFVAMCRTAEVPARMVWVDGHQYAEFYLEEAEGQGYWFPVQSAGSRSFGEMPVPKVILQKGDNFRVPERRRERLRYASDYTLLLAEPQFKPTVRYIREQL